MHDFFYAILKIFIETNIDLDGSDVNDSYIMMKLNEQLREIPEHFQPFFSRDWTPKIMEYRRVEDNEDYINRLHSDDYFVHFCYL